MKYVDCSTGCKGGWCHGDGWECVPDSQVMEEKEVDLSEQQIMQIMVTTVGKTCEALTDVELNAIYMVALLGSNPTHVGGYEKVKSLFTEQNETRMHPTTVDALEIVWRNRIQGKE